MIIALQFYEGDSAETMRLGRLLADLEPAPRKDVDLAFVYQPDTPITPLVLRTIDHCSRRFKVLLEASPYGAKGHPLACTALWRGTASLFMKKWSEKHSSILMLDGGDGIPLHPNWIDLIRRQHHISIGNGKLITGSPYFIGTCPLHVNPNAVFHIDFFRETSVADKEPPCNAGLESNFDIYHRDVMLPRTHLTSTVATDWRGGGRRISRELLLDKSKHAIWLHGYRDSDMHFIARDHLSHNLPIEPEIFTYNIEDLRVQEQVRRDYERSVERSLP
jgi:hypothetical protein